MLDGFPLRKYDWKDWLFMIITSSLFLQIIGGFILTFSVMYAVEFVTMDMLIETSIYATVYGTILSLPLTLWVVYRQKIPLFNRKQLSKEESFIFRGMTKKDWKFLLVYNPTSYIVYLLGGMVVGYFFGISEAANQVAVESLFGFIPPWVLFIMIVIVAPIGEELLFRGLMLFPGDRLETSWLRVILSAILFGAIHGPTDIYSAYTYIGMGLIFAVASKYTRSVETGMIYHFLNNLVGFIAIMSL